MSIMSRVRRATLCAAVAGLTIAAGPAAPVGASAAPAAQTPICVVSASPSSFTESGLSSATTTAVAGNGDTFDVRLDPDGNATLIVLGGPSCAASSDLIEADLTVAPYTTATTQVRIAAPASTQPRVRSLPASQVEDATTSSVATVFYVEFPSAFSEYQVQISDAELFNSCAGHIAWMVPDSTALKYGNTVTMTLDDAGNTFVVALAGPSCASGRTLVQAELAGPPYTTVSAQFTVLSPRVTVKGSRP
jgi:hypothetical protein